MSGTDVNYMNASALAPKFDWQPQGFLAGMMHRQNELDYRQAFDQQMRLQNLAEEERRIDLGEKYKNLPLQELERSVKMEAQRGMLPHAQRQSSSGALSTIAENEIKASPERRAADIGGFRQKLSDSERKIFDNSMDYMGTILPYAMQLRQTNPAAAMDFMKQKVAEGRARGIELPREIDNPFTWEALLEGATQSVQYRQKAGLTRLEGDERRKTQGEELKVRERMNTADNNTRLEATRITADATRDAAATRASSSSPKTPGFDPRVVQLINKIASDPSASAQDVQQLEALLDLQFERMNANTAILRDNPEAVAKYNAQKQSYIDGVIEGRLGIRRPKPQGRSGQNDPLGIR